MSEYWVSKKKYYCKYCEIYIADDAPSRQHHESGMRHKGNLERYIRGIYKTGEKRKKDLEEEKREMAAVERAANAAFAQDVGAGLAKAPAPVASSSKTTKPAAKPSNPYANYTTAQQLGYSDPDAERLEKEAEVRRSQGVAGEWEVVSVVPTPQRSQTPEGGETDVKPDVVTAAVAGEKRPADAGEEEDTSSFRFRKKRVIGLGDVYDPGLIPIKLKKKEEPSPPVPPAPGSTNSHPSQSTISDELPRWTPLLLKRPSEPSSTSEADSPTVKSEPQSDLAPVTESATPQEGSEKKADSAGKWSKSSWGVAAKPDPNAPPPDFSLSNTAVTGDVPANVGGVEGEESKPPLDEPPAPPVPKFKKRKAPASAAKGRRVL